MIGPSIAVLSPPMAYRALLAMAFVLAGCLSMAVPHLQAGQPCHAQYVQHNAHGGGSHKDGAGHAKSAVTDATCMMHCIGVAILLPDPTIAGHPLWRGVVAPVHDTESSTVYRLDRPPKTFT
ncbi:hypothetical protein ACO2I3_13955 [Leptospira interrogans]